MCKQWTAVLALVAVGLLLGIQFRQPVDRFHTLASLRKVDEHPLYVMRYYGDYGSIGLLQQQATATDLVAAAPVCAGQAWACACFANLGEGTDVLLGRNFDWYDHAALLLYTDPNDGYASVSMVDISYLGLGREIPSWTDRQRLLLAPHLPFDGMNERGLGVGMMAVPFADSGRDPQKTTLDSLQVIRLLLDHAADVGEALALLEDCNIDFGQGPPVHYLLVDAQRRSAVVEFVDGERVVLWNEDPWQVATNFVISQAMPLGSDSECWRYNLAYDTLAESLGTLVPTEAMQLLKRTSQGSTIWSLVYHLDSGAFDVVMSRDYDTVHRFKL